MFVSNSAHFSLLSDFVAQFSNGGVERDSLEEYELLAGNGDGNYGFISWFKGKVYILLIMEEPKLVLRATNSPILLS